ncbi:hypothetical protein DPMN_115875 [Dreissena polymorpha]|uniref:Uncharacterized protein n=1 Tax=Dreissena polymorpha TaxID=45954 RepID=A0A9D4KMS8_DREPO|nr:hypothetical protein DPMN_115853 [Dreissena polymorpha]KAH3842379.1 hypothetical protein DPMN_115875 [Dreissena polymorpha]
MTPSSLDPCPAPSHVDHSLTFDLWLISRILTISAELGTALDCLEDVIPTLEEVTDVRN